MDDERSCWDDEGFLDAVLDFSEKYKGKSMYTGNASCLPPRKKAKHPLSHSNPITTSLKTYCCWDDEAFVDAVFKFSEKHYGKSLYTGNASCLPPRKKAKQPLSHSKPMTASLKTLDGYHKPELSMTVDRHKEWSDEWDQDFLYEVIKLYDRDYKYVTEVKAEPLSQFKATGSLKTPAGTHNQVDMVGREFHMKP